MRGYAGIVVGFIMLVLLLSVGAYLLSVGVGNSMKLSSAQKFAQQVQFTKQRMAVEILSVYWDQIGSSIHIFAKNTGSVGFDLNSVDVFANSVFLGKCSDLNCSDSSGDSYVSPGEEFEITASYSTCPSNVVISPGPGVFSSYSVACHYAWVFFDSPPTPVDGASVSAGSSVEVRIRAESTDVNSIYLDWNGFRVDYDPYLVGDSSIHDINDSSLVLAMSFNDVSLVGEDYNTSSYVHDYSQYGNDGTNNGATYVSGRYGGAFYFNTDSNIVIPDSSSLDITGSLTISAWLKAFSLYGTVLAKTGSYAFILDYNRLRFMIWSGGTLYDVYGPIGISDGQWHHVSAVYDSTAGTLSLYVDGSEVNSTSVGSLSVDVTTNPVYIGRMQYWTGYDLNGSLDDVTLYTRALSPEEIWALAHSASYVVDGNTFLDFNTPALSSGTYDYYGWAENTAGLSDYTHSADGSVEYNATNPRVLNVT